MPEFRVALRHTTLIEAAALQPQDDGSYFIATAAPPPTNSILTLHEGAEVQYLVVDRVVEVEHDDRTRGLFGKLTDAEAHTEASTLGTEHLEDGSLAVNQEEMTLQMAVPAPVVDPDPSAEVDLGERRRLEAMDDDTVAPEIPDSQASGAAEPATSESSEGDEPAASDRRGRKRRGRKRR